MTNVLFQWLGRCIKLLCVVLLLVSATSLFGQSENTLLWSNVDVGSHVAVQTRAGRSIRGTVDARTNRQYFWVTADAEGMTVSSRLTAEEIISILPSDPVVLPPLELQQPPRSLEQNAISSSAAVSTPRSLTVVAHLGNWDSDAEDDGLIVHLFPLGSQGELVPTSGSVSVTLRTYRGDARSKRAPVEVVETWSAQIKSSEFTAEGVSIRLPFQKIKPDQELDLQPVADLQVRLNIPGKTTLDAIQRDVLIRNFSATRDLQTLRSSPNR